MSMWEEPIKSTSMECFGSSYSPMAAAVYWLPRILPDKSWNKNRNSRRKATAEMARRERKRLCIAGTPPKTQNR